MNYYPYDIKNANNIYKYAKNLEGLTFFDVINNDNQNSSQDSLLEDKCSANKNKGSLGQVIENHYFKYQCNNDSDPDFKEAGLELKVTPYKKNKNGTISAKERLVLTMIDYAEVAKEAFENSHLWYKCKLILLIYYEHNYDLKNNLDFRIRFVELFTPQESDKEQIKNDYIYIQNKIRQGKAHELSEADTFYLGAVTKSSNSLARRSQPFSDVPAKPRAFSYKCSYMTRILNEIANKNSKYESIVNDNQCIPFEEEVIKRINKYRDRSLNDLIRYFNFDNSRDPKNLESLIVFKMLGIKGNKAEEFEKANIVVKTIRIGKDNKIKENMSFPAFKFKELINEDWNDSKFGNYLKETKFLFVVYKYESNNDLILKGCQFWNMPYQTIEGEVKRVWEKTKKIILNGVNIEEINGKTINNLPKQKDSPICHVRPHARNKNDVYELPDGRLLTKQCFWLNNSYIYSQINDEIKLDHF